MTTGPDLELGLSKGLKYKASKLKGLFVKIRLVFLLIPI